ncbi:hypothetical protein A1351_15530 [Methylosinus sp. R-45379]|uniref:phage tail length tape measure family protein n=1 Tax=Methylosinus sp. R-45379 TaxID=980563 RepID=UPI0007C8F126|nr:phage tail length tape measure family protein [Methylosinus sp. R-45379]OAI25962.1 hypothetical protein A1351_15530 [Methylosinus sp. R-45379]
MATDTVAIRLTSQGGDQIMRALEQIGAAAQTQFRRAAEEARNFSREASSLARNPVSQTPFQIAANSFAGMGGGSDYAARAADIAAYGAELDRVRAKFSPLYAVERQHVAVLREIDEAARSGALSHVEAASAADRLAAAYERQRAAAVAQLQAPLNDRLSVRDDFDSERRAADISAYGAELDRLRAKYAPLYAAQRQYKDSLDEIRKAARAGALSQQEAAAAIERVKRAFAEKVPDLVGGPSAPTIDPMIASLTQWSAEAGTMSGRLDAWSRANRVAASDVDAHAKSVGLARHEWINLSRQFQDVGVSLAGGQAPLTVLIQQGSQIADVFSSSRGGAGATLKEFGATALRIATSPLTLLTVGLGAASYAVHQFAQQNVALERSLNGVGRLSGASVGDLRQLANGAASSGQLSLSQALGGATTFAGAGIGVENMPRLLADSQRFAHAFGLDLDAAQQEIAQIVGGEGLAAMEKRFGPISFGVKEMVRSLEATGHYSEAAALKTRLFDEETQKAKDSATALQKTWEDIKRLFDGAGNWVGRVIAPTDEQELDRLKKVRAAMDAKPGGIAGLLGMAPLGHSPYLDQQITEYERKIAERDDNAARERRSLELNRLSDRAGSIIDERNPDLGQLRGLRESRDALQKLLGSDDGLAKLGDRAGEARKTLADLETQIGSWRGALDRMREDSALQVREIMARTFAERESVAMDRARLQVLRESGDAARASVAAETERARLLAESARKVDDYTRASRDQLQLAGMTSYERGRQQILNDARDFRRENLPAAAAPMAREFDVAAAAARKVSEAFQGLAGAIGGKIGAQLPIFARAGAGGLALAGEAAPYAAIMSAEGTSRFGDPYNVSLGYRRSPRPLTTMTMDEAIAWGEEIARQEMSRTGLSRREVSSAKGAFQIVNSTQRDAMRALGLSGSDQFSAENQNKMADWIMKTQGIGAWKGFDRPGVAAPATDDLGRKYDAGVADRLKAYDVEQIDNRLRDANNGLREQNSLLDAQREFLTADNATLSGVIESQKQLNYFTTQRITIDDDLKRKIAEVGEAEAERARKEEELSQAKRRYTEDLDFARNGVSGTLSSVAKAAANGQDVGKAALQSLTRLRDNAIDMVTGRFTEDLLGRTGTTNGGILGGLLGFGSKQNVATMQVQAANVMIGGGVGGLPIGGGSGGLFGGLFGNNNFAGQPAGAIGPFPQAEGGGFFSSLFSSIGGLFGFADGGVMTSRGPLPLRRYADGGVASSPQLAMFGEGSGPEAYVPLKNGAIPVRLAQPRATPISGAYRSGVTVNVTNNRGHDTDVSVERMSDGDINVLINHKISGALQNYSRNILDIVQDRQNRA